ncbi:nicotinamide N-methyltransferase [Pichia membranifaciens]|uniref:Nicotinamide N-methyltransferase n=1 Tax=Pichia membranifaciens TaxID=4926 RepID=A0A1Q2YK89_9ASCO|nr:nicotinamide N-methyltransferase [Pichia membranifaciens]
MSDSEILLEGDIFEEPEDFRPPKPDSHFAKYERKYCIPEAEKGIKEINLRLVGKSPLWGHLLWNAGVYTADYVEKHAAEFIKGKRIVEFGAASALPSLLCSLNGAEKVVCTDYPDPDLLENIRYNVDHLASPEAQKLIDVEGFIWGNDTSEISAKIGGTGKADFLILSDLVFNHSEHHKLLKSCKKLIKPLDGGKARTGGKCLVVWSPHRTKPKMIENDFKFFTDAKEVFDFDVEMVEMVHWDHPMFPEEAQETEEIRKRVYCYLLHPTW